MNTFKGAFKRELLKHGYRPVKRLALTLYAKDGKRCDMAIAVVAIVRRDDGQAR